MLNFFKLVSAIVLLAGWGLAALSLHVVRTNTAIKLIPKNELSVGDTYVDVRHWTSADENVHPALFARLKQLDQTDLLAGATPDASPAHPENPTAVATASSSSPSIADTWYRINRPHAGR